METVREGTTSEGVDIRGGTANEAMQKFGPLNATLQVILANRANREVRFQPTSPGSHLC